MYRFATIAKQKEQTSDVVLILGPIRLWNTARENTTSIVATKQVLRLMWARVAEPFPFVLNIATPSKGMDNTIYITDWINLKQIKIIFFRADERPYVSPYEDIPTSNDEEYDTGDSQAPMPDEQSVPAESAQQMQPDEELFEEVEYLDIQPDEEAVKDESLEAATNQNNEQNNVRDDQNPLAGEDDNYCGAVKDESFEMGPLRSSLNANESNESNDCVFISKHYLQVVVDETDETDNWSRSNIHPIISYSFDLISFFMLRIDHVQTSVWYILFL